MRPSSSRTRSPACSTSSSGSGRPTTRRTAATRRSMRCSRAMPTRRSCAGRTRPPPGTSWPCTTSRSSTSWPRSRSNAPAPRSRRRPRNGGTRRSTNGRGCGRARSSGTGSNSVSIVWTTPACPPASPRRFVPRCPMRSARSTPRWRSTVHRRRSGTNPPRMCVSPARCTMCPRGPSAPSRRRLPASSRASTCSCATPRGASPATARSASRSRRGCSPRPRTSLR